MPNVCRAVTEGIGHSTNSFGKITTGDRARLEVKGKGSDIVAVAIGGAKCEETLRRAPAFVGADRVIHVREESELQPFAVAGALPAVLRKAPASRLQFARQPIGDDASQTSQMTASLLDVTQPALASEMELNISIAIVTRRVRSGRRDRGFVVRPLSAAMSVVVQVDERRDLRLPGIMRASEETAHGGHRRVLVRIAPRAQSASRALVDSGDVLDDVRAQPTSKNNAPEPDITVGVSGAMQHFAGINKEARTIVASNKDTQAPIFEIAQVGLVGDRFTVPPELTEKL